MEIKISHNFAEVQRQLATLQRDVADQALRSAVNRTMAQGQTQMVRAIAGEFNLSQSKIREKMFLRKAGFKAGRLGIEAVLESKTQGGKRRAINVINFGARSTARGLTARIRRSGGRVVVHGQGFIGNKGRTAFVRVGEKRLPIKPLQTVDVPQMFNTKRINAPVVAFIRRKFPELFEREARYYTDRFNSSR
jgi:hypothetical protein